MKNTAFITKSVWPELTRAVRASRSPCFVAVAYFGAGAGRLLPLRRGSRLVFDLSERAVKSGQSSPVDLLRLLQRGVRVFTVRNLHAKVYVTDRRVFVGSANASRHSAGTLVEAIMSSADRTTIRAAQEFVRSLCVHELKPELLRQLAKLYRPSKIPGGGRKVRTARTVHPEMSPLFIFQLVLGPWPEREQTIHDQGLRVAKSRRKHPRRFPIESFRYSGTCPCSPGDQVIQVLTESPKRVMVSPPATVTHVRSFRTKGGRASYIYVQRASNQRRRSLASVAEQFGRGGRKVLSRNGLVRNQDLARSLALIWAK